MKVLGNESADNSGISNHLHLRQAVEQILKSPPPPQLINLESLPIAGLKSFEYQNQLVRPQEIIPIEYQPVIILDLDDTIWPQVEHLIAALSEASGIPITMDYFKSIGHTRKIPEWQTDEIKDIHDQINRGEHPDYLPHFGRAFPEALKTISALPQMGHHFSYLTSREFSLFNITIQTLQWNQLPTHPETEPIDALNHPTPLKGHLYCTPPDLDSGTEYKYQVITQWLENLRAAGWQGTMVVIDDLLKALKPHLDSNEIIGISPISPLNHHTQPYEKEIRLDSWREISQHLINIHQKTIATHPSPFRIFNCSPTLSDTLLVVSKQQVGFGQFDLKNIPFVLVNKQQWLENQPSTLQLFKSLSAEPAVNISPFL